MTNVLLIATVAVSLGGCAVPANPRPESAEAHQSDPVEDNKVTSPAQDKELLGVDYWEMGKETINVTLYGSGSCPPKVEKVVQNDSGIVKVHLDESDLAKVCTADLAPHNIELAGITPDDVKQVEVVSDSGTKTLPQNSNKS